MYNQFMHRYNNTIKGFTLIEVIVGIVALTIIALALGKAFQMNLFLIKSVKASAELYKGQVALTHIVENAHSSAWIEIVDTNTIKLYSHSNPNIREYKLLDNILKYKERNGDYTVLLKDVESNALFKGLGDEKPGNRFSMVEIEFWNIGSSSSNRLHTVAGAKESWDMVYVDTLSTEERADGTKLFPYKTLADALTNGADNYRFYYNVWAGVTEKIALLNGSHSFSDSFDIKHQTNLIFFKDTSLTIEPGTVLTLGNRSSLAIQGEFYFLGEETNSITIQGTGSGRDITVVFPDGAKYTEYVKDTWRFISVTNDNPDFYNYNIQHAIMSGGEQGFSFAKALDASNEVQVTFSNNDVKDLYLCPLSISGVTDVQVRNNRFETDSGLVRIAIGDQHLSYINPPQRFGWGSTYGDISFIVEDNNEFLDRCGLNMYLTLRTERSHGNLTIKVNSNKMISYGLLRTIELISYSANALVSVEMINNKIEKADVGSGTGIHIGHIGGTPPVGSQFLIKNNTIINNGISLGNDVGITVLNMKLPLIITNNEITGFSHGIWHVTNQTLAGQVLTIENNLIHDCAYSSIKVAPFYSGPSWYMVGMINVKNNIIYNCGGIYCGDCAVIPGEPGMTLTYNTLDGIAIGGNADLITIDDCIIWGDEGVEYVPADILAKTTNSDVRNVTPEDYPGQNIISAYPQFKTVPDEPYELEETSPCMDHPPGLGNQIGAHGPDGNGWDNNIGSNLP